MTHSLRGRLMLLMLVTAIPAFAVIAYFTQWLRVHETQREEEAMLTLAQSLAGKQQKNLDNTVLLLARLARMPEIHASGSRCVENLSDVMAMARPHIANVFIIRPDGEIGCAARDAGKPVNVADQAWFRDALATTGFKIGAYRLDSRAGTPSVLISHTLRRHGKVIEVLVASMELSWLTVQRDAARPSTLYAIFDNSGTPIVCRPGSALIGLDFAGQTFWHTLAKLRGPTLFRDIGEDQVERLFAYAPLGSGQQPYARLVVGVPAATLDTSSRELFLLGLAALAAAMGLGLLAGWFGSEHFVLRPLRPLLETVQRVTSGDLSVHAARDHMRDDEISKLATELDRMTEAVSQRDLALTEARDRAQAYLDIVGVMVLVLNGKGTIVLANLETRKVLGCEDSDLGGNWIDHWVAPDERTRAKERFLRLLAGDSAAGGFHESSIQTIKGKLRLIAWRQTPLKDKKGDIIGVLCAGNDVTEQSRLQADEERLRIQLQQAQKMEALGQLSGGIAHDFNNILSIVLGFAKLALRRHAPDPDSELAEYLREVILAGERARDLVAQMLAYSRTQPGRPAQALAPSPLVKEVVKMLSAAIPAGIRINTRFGEDLPCIAIDPVSFHQILMNLIINARDALVDGGHIDIGLSRQRVDHRICIDCHESFTGEYLELRVSDDGLGISPEVMTRMFEPFFTTKEVGKGSGMGLAMVHGLVRRAGGHFQVESTPGQGTAFRIYLPALALTAHGEADSDGSDLSGDCS